ncbi:MAG: hypothetical protein MJ238_04300 [Bacilli bacterium]|nr:hypothetical protein [Bacilli bacterium]
MTKTELKLLKKKIDEYIEKNYVREDKEFHREELVYYKMDLSTPSPRRRSSPAREAGVLYSMISLPPKEKTFQEEMFELIDKKEMSDVEFYKRAHIDRKLFSKIRSNADYKPNMTTAVCVALALRLNIKETARLLARASLSLSPSKNWDLIITYCIENGVYDINDINQILYEYNESLLYL